MSPNGNLEIREGAIFVADAHDGDERTNFLIFLQKLKKKEIVTTQLFLMGDMFDFLIDSEYVKKKYQKQISLIDELSEKMEIYYFEGNHDFGLKKIFPKVKVVDIKMQPTKFYYKDKIMMLSHGDIFGGLGYKIFTSILRSSLVLKSWNFLDKILSFQLSKSIFRMQNKKIICKKYLKFEKKIESKISNYKKCDFIVEGHFHQGKQLQINTLMYINIPSLACDLRYIQIKDYFFIEI